MKTDMADNYLERKYEEYLKRKQAAEKARKARLRKHMDEYRKKLARQQEEDGKQPRP